MTFKEIMNNWIRMCKYYGDNYGSDACEYCAMNDVSGCCQPIYESEENSNWDKVESVVKMWVNNHPTSKTWMEWLISKNLFNKDASANEVMRALNHFIPDELMEELDKNGSESK